MSGCGLSETFRTRRRHAVAPHQEDQRGADGVPCVSQHSGMPDDQNHLCAWEHAGSPTNQGLKRATKPVPRHTQTQQACSGSSGHVRTQVALHSPSDNLARHRNKRPDLRHAILDLHSDQARICLIRLTLSMSARQVDAVRSCGWEAACRASSPLPRLSLPNPHAFPGVAEEILSAIITPVHPCDPETTARIRPGPSNHKPVVFCA